MANFLQFSSGHYSTWTKTDEISPNYCHGAPFLMAFITLICYWVGILIAIIIGTVFCLYMMSKKRNPNKMDVDHSYKDHDVNC